MAALERSSVNEHQKAKLMAVLSPEFISSEESNDDSEDDEVPDSEEPSDEEGIISLSLRQ